MAQELLPRPTAQPAQQPAQPMAVSETFRKVLVPVGLSEDSHRALLVALDLQRAFGAEVQVVTFTEFGENEQFNRGLGAMQTDDDLEQSTLGRLQRFVQNVVPGALDRVTCRAIEDNDIPGGVDRCATEWQATLVILTTHHKASVFRSLAEKVIQALGVPVLLLK